MFLPHWGCLGRCGTKLGGRNNLVSKLVWFYLIFPTSFLSAFSPLSLFPVCRLVSCSDLEISALGVVLVARMTLFLMGSCQTPLAYSEPGDLLDGWTAMDISALRVSGVEWRLRRAQCRPMRVHGIPDRDGI